MEESVSLLSKYKNNRLLQICKTKKKCIYFYLYPKCDIIIRQTSGLWDDFQIYPTECKDKYSFYQVWKIMIPISGQKYMARAFAH
jgi:hypothetical protein